MQDQVTGIFTSRRCDPDAADMQYTKHNMLHKKTHIQVSSQGPRQTTMACSACFEVLADPRYLHMTVGMYDGVEVTEVEYSC
jgi:hypothetical protein